ncbi:uncharacterized protein AKAW2_80480A [Aspergillus luchuensis]|uniref:Uncharacterized protein n=1 Tax=Aspergillus kawachii TaxID=1069201 RepID=A0A146F929_ASPKA|nr:uncharacterized protein AKAW2_80480A [Aspergillus luchuensis]BCS04679.1 hypothetical protein AKAW2_80480A [Aspergillus luchuensis]BCS16248.1 hypothetical protein ALUC_80455A [Aspergillus luchuensis]GAA83754.1 hypothetical protein AKAW_01869 [Aspergillus luchuensis IFO 4308]GAT22497.1 hypothetical protein RIB2604_01505310 [Aspergillus luchuensis]
MSTSTSESASNLPVPPRQDVDAHHQAWTDWARRAPGQKLTPEKERHALACATEIQQAVRAGHIKPEHARKAYEIVILTAHRESDFNPEAKNPNSSATGMLQQTMRFHERSPLNPASVRNVPLTTEQRMDVKTSAGFFYRQLAHTPNWHEMKIQDAAHQVQKFPLKDMHRYADPEITREAVCLGGALFPGQPSMVDNAAYSDQEKANLSCPDPSRFGCPVGTPDEGTPDEGTPEPSEQTTGDGIRFPEVHLPSDVPPIDLGPKDPMPKEARQKWDHAVKTNSIDPGTAILGMGGGAALGAATAGGVTVVPSSAGLALSFNLLHPAGQIGALIGLGVAGTYWAYNYFTRDDVETQGPSEHQKK